MKYHRMYGILSKRKQKSTDWNLKSLVGYLPPWHSSTDTMSPRPGMRFFSGASRLGEIQWYGWDDFPVTFRFQQLLFREPSMHHPHSFIYGHAQNLWLTLSSCCLIIKKIWSKANHQGQTGHKVGSSSSWMERILYSKGDMGSYKPFKHLQSSPLLQKTLTFHKLHASTTTAPSAPSSHQPQSACPVTVQLFSFANSPLTNGSWWLKKGDSEIGFFSSKGTVFDNWLVQYLPPKKKNSISRTPPDVAPGASHEWLLIHR